MSEVLKNRGVQSVDLIAHAIRDAIDHAKLAYEFGFGSYAMSTLNACLQVEHLYRNRQGPDWIAEVTAYDELEREPRHNFQQEAA